jgi:hypothetical protein
MATKGNNTLKGRSRTPECVFDLAGTLIEVQAAAVDSIRSHPALMEPKIAEEAMIELRRLSEDDERIGRGFSDLDEPRRQSYLRWMAVLLAHGRQTIETR